MKIERQANGALEIWADDVREMHWAMGYAHAQDRLMQMLTTRLLGQGRISEVLFDTDESFGADLLARKMNFAREDPTPIDPPAKELCQAYCEGVNHYLAHHHVPFQCRLLRYTPTPWTLRDIQTLIGVHMYYGLAQIQERVERFIIRALHDGIPLEEMQKLFLPHLNGMTEEYVALLRQIALERPFFDKALSFTPAQSNNWVLSGKKTVSKTPFFAFDPHLQVNRLPAIWAEMVCHTPENDYIGITVPGVPTLVMGRTRHLAASFTSGMMDTIDFFFIKSTDSFKTREEVFHRKKNGEVTAQFYEGRAGVLERPDVTQKSLNEELYLSLAFSATSKTKILNCMAKIWESRTVMEAQEILKEFPMSCNWVLADTDGNIGYQQSGEGPVRPKHSGLYPVPAWEAGALWEGKRDPNTLKRELNPARGFCASANNDQGNDTITFPFKTYRFRRIEALLSEDKQFTLDEMKAMQVDVYSTQAELFMEKIAPLLPQSPAGDILRNWDNCYDRKSIGAVLFERIYRALFIEVFGELFGRDAWEAISHKHSLLVYAHGQFDNYLLQKWDGERFRPLIEEELAKGKIATWEEERKFWMSHLVLDGKLPKWTKLDLGPIALQGGRATLPAVHIFNEQKRTVVAASSYRLVCDLASDETHTILAGGPSESRFSSLYASDLKMWAQGELKTLHLSGKP